MKGTAILNLIISGGYFLTNCRLYIVALNRRTKFRANISVNDWIFKFKMALDVKVFPFSSCIISS